MFIFSDGDGSQAATGKSAAASSTAAEIGDSAYSLTPGKFNTLLSSSLMHGPKRVIWSNEFLFLKTQKSLLH